jgi:hypothetical protein
VATLEPNHFTYSTNDLIENNAGFTIFPEKRFYYLQSDFSSRQRDLSRIRGDL